MLHVWMICLLAALFVSDSTPAPIAALLMGEQRWAQVSSWWVIGGYVGAITALAAAVMLLIARDGRRLEHTGRARHIRRAHFIADFSQGAAVGLHVVGVIGFGWLDAVRWLLDFVPGLGNVILLDELLAVTPALLVFVVGWWALYGIDRRCREAALMGALDGPRNQPETARPVHLPTRGQFVLSHVRHQMLLSLVPLALIVGWAESMDRLVLLAEKGAIPGATGSWLAGLVSSGEARENVRAALHFGGVVVILMLAPLVLRAIWQTAPLPASPLRDRLEEICREARVRVRNILVWRTHGSMINGAVVGFVPWLRYILLTDALLESLSRREVEAVMAHEVAHARHRHMPWLAVVLITALMAALLLASLAVSGLAALQWTERFFAEESTVAAIAIESAIGGFTLITAFIVFGWASRRFEWQADAFAVQCLSRSPGDASPPATEADAPAADADGDAPQATSPVMTPSAVGAMAGALGAVATLNGIPRNRRSWRHGSIATRQARLRALAGRSIKGTPIDRTVRRIKLGAAAGFVVLIAAFLLLT